MPAQVDERLLARCDGCAPAPRARPAGRCRGPAPRRPPGRRSRRRRGRRRRAARGRSELAPRRRPARRAHARRPPPQADAPAIRPTAQGATDDDGGKRVVGRPRVGLCRSTLTQATARHATQDEPGPVADPHVRRASRAARSDHDGGEEEVEPIPAGETVDRDDREQIAAAARDGNEMRRQASGRAQRQRRDTIELDRRLPTATASAAASKATTTASAMSATVGRRMDMERTLTPGRKHFIHRVDDASDDLGCRPLQQVAPAELTPSLRPGGRRAAPPRSQSAVACTRPERRPAVLDILSPLQRRSPAQA